MENYREKFRYYCYENIDRVDFVYNDKEFGINTITSNIDNFDELFLSEKFSKKVINAVDVLAQKLEREITLLNNGRKNDIINR